MACDSKGAWDASNPYHCAKCRGAMEWRRSADGEEGWAHAPPVQRAIVLAGEPASQPDALQAEVERLRKLVFVPGMLKCAKCRLVLISTNLNMRDGTLTANDTTERCPNGCGPLWKVTERDAGNDMVDRCEEQVLRAVAAEAERDALLSLLTPAVRDVLDERRRQIEREGFTPRHDRTHHAGQLALAAACYAGRAHAGRKHNLRVPFHWPWEVAWWKPAKPYRMLVKAAALIFAELERLSQPAAPQGIAHVDR